jgi:hypothetical protein
MLKVALKQLAEVMSMVLGTVALRRWELKRATALGHSRASHWGATMVQKKGFPLVNWWVEVMMLDFLYLTP